MTTPQAKGRLALNTLPAVVFVVPALICAVVLPWQKFVVLLTLTATSFFYAGRFVILSPVLEPRISFEPYHLAGVVVVLDVCVALLISINFDLLYGLPRASRFLKVVEEKSKAMLHQRKWMRRVAVLGTIVYVALPFPGTGSIGGSIVGRLVGLKPGKILACVLGGSLIGSSAMAFGGQGLAALVAPIQHEPWFRVMGFGIVGVVTIALVWLGLRARQPLPPVAEDAESGGEDPYDQKPDPPLG